MNDRFAEFYRALHNREPFPWQVRLAELACAGQWPRALALPTASGNTTCLSIAVFALAAQAECGATRTAPRRIFFVVDRRVIVDAAYEEARRLAEALRGATSGVVFAVAQRLRSLAGGQRPLDVYQLRGGIYRDDAWAQTPLQPTVIASTVDQIGSRLLFRGYGLRSGYARPIHAGLAGNDCLIILDEAHCAQPFAQTAAAVERYRGWGQAPLASPFRVVLLSATPPQDLPAGAVLHLDDADRADAVLRPRLLAQKPAKLIVATSAKGKTAPEKIAAELVAQAKALAVGEVRSVGILVNRVATARAVFALLIKRQDADAVLFTGRMRPLDRTQVQEDWLARLQAGNTTPLERPVFVAATQCLEVGADLDFQALVTECASLDALRQRFGRLNRLGARAEAPAVIVVRGDQTDPTDDPKKLDPVYGNSIARTWQWLNAQATAGVIDMGIAAFAARETPPAELNAPAPDAPVLLPAHLDCWAQTDPEPAPSPDVSVFLHGPQQGRPEVQVCWRADLAKDDREKWIEAVALCPPSSAECMPVPLFVVRAWLAGTDASAEVSDVEGGAEPEPAEGDPAATRAVLRWRGPDDSEVSSDPDAIWPGDTLVIPVELGGWDEFGHIPAECLHDLGDQAFRQARATALLRLTKTVVEAWQVPVPEELTTATALPEDETMLNDALEAIAQHEKVQAAGWEWLREVAAALAADKRRVIEVHPLGGLVVRGSKRLPGDRADQSFTDEDDSSSATTRVTLKDHCAGVAQRAEAFARGCGLPEELVAAVRQAAAWHDLGKGDPRFQAWLHNGNRRKVVGDLLAKSAGQPASLKLRREARERSGYPSGMRHELLSVRLAESRLADIPEALRELVLHLIGSHHGRCRPFAPVIDDAAPILNLSVPLNGEMFETATTATGLERLDSGVAERFWRLLRRYGWWGLPLLETLVRLADHRQSESEQRRSHNGT